MMESTLDAMARGVVHFFLSPSAGESVALVPTTVDFNPPEVYGDKPP